MFLSPDHHAPACRHFGTCGGCALQNLDDAAYAAFKIDQVHKSLAASGLVPGVVDGPHISAPGTRRRATMAAYRDTTGKTVLGFNEPRSNKIVDLEECPVLNPRLVALVPLLREILPGILQNGQGMDIAMTDSAGAVDMVMRPWVKKKKESDHLPRHIIERLAAFAEKADLARLSWQNDATDESDLLPVVWRGPFTVDFAGVTVTPPPGAFLQATPQGQAVLTDAVLAALASSRRKPKRIVDLYAGCGTFTFALAAQKYKVHAVEGFAPALEALRAASGGMAVTAEKRDLANDPLMPKELNGYDAVIIDPPRVGAAGQMRKLVRSDVKLVVSVSCGLNSFITDAAVLTGAGFGFEKLTVVDQFLWSPHIELVGVFRR